jgi:hypothetical protein
MLIHFPSHLRNLTCNKYITNEACYFFLQTLQHLMELKVGLAPWWQQQTVMTISAEWTLHGIHGCRLIKREYRTPVPMRNSQVRGPRQYWGQELSKVINCIGAVGGDGYMTIVFHINVVLCNYISVTALKAVSQIRA